MKIYFKFISLMIFASLLLFAYGCEKEVLDNSILQEEIVDSNNPPNEPILNSPVNPCYDGIFDSIQVVNGMLKFIDMDHLEDVYNCLEFQYEEHQVQFENTYGHLSLEKMDSMEIVIGFNHWKPYEDLENLLNFSSRREYIENLIVSFLDQTNPDWGAHPDDLDGLDETFRTLVNIDGLLLVNSDSINFLDLENSSEIDGGSTERSEGCRYWGKLVQYPVFNIGQNRIKHKTKFNGHYPVNRVKGKVVHHKLKNNGKWKRSREVLKISTTGSITRSAVNCDSPKQIGSSKGPKKRRQLKTKKSNWGETAKYKSGEVGSTALVGAGSNPFQHHQVITW